VVTCYLVLGTDLVSKLGPMVPGMKACGKTTKQMVMENSGTQTETSTRVSGEMTKPMVRVYTHTRMVLAMKDIG